jgi:acetolactate synthase-1/2/3 large subunit
MSTPTTKPAPQTGAELLVKSLEAQGVEYIFDIPGAKIDKVFDTLLDSKIKTIVCRHEQNAAFMASGIGRMTGKAGVALVTSGPGCSNLVTGFATATSEGDPVVGIGGAVPVADRLKQLHQSMDTVNLFRPVTKFSAEIDSASSVSEVVANAFRAAESGRPGAAFISAPKDVMMGEATGEVLTPAAPVSLGAADTDAIATAASLMSRATNPVLMLGLLASEKNAAESVSEFIAKTNMPVVCTYQGAGVVPREHCDHFAGRVGLFRTQPADRILDAADLVITIGYDPIEFEPGLWNRGKKRNVIHIDVVAGDIDKDYRPHVELTGSIAATLRGLTSQTNSVPPAGSAELLREVALERTAMARKPPR